MWNIAQNFQIDSSLFYAESFISIPRVDLFFKALPTAANNSSGIINPGITVTVVSTTNHTPNLQDTVTYQNLLTRVEYPDIKDSNDASRMTTIIFDQPILCSTGQEFSIIVKFDGNANFVLWEDVTGAPLIGPLPISSNGAIGNTVSTQLSPGPSCKYVGPMFTGSLPSPVITQNAASGAISTPNITNVQTYPDSTNWNPDPNTCLKFNVWYNRYNANGQSVITTVNTSVNTTVGASQNTNTLTTYPGVTVTPPSTTFTIPTQKMEYLSYNPSTSGPFQMLIGDLVWQEQPFWRGGDGNAANNGNPYTVSVAANNMVVSAVGQTDFTKLFSGGPDPEYITIHSKNHNGANLDLLNTRRVYSFNSSTITVQTPIQFNNSAAFYYKSPVAMIQHSTFDLFDNSNNGLLFLRDSNANASLRFTDHTVFSFAIANGGASYSNTDWLKITGYEDIACVVQGHFAAFANLQTNTSGGITNLFFSNTGSGFTNTANVTFTFFTSANAASAGSGANISLIVDAKYRSERLDPATKLPTYFMGANLKNLPVDLMMPSLAVVQPDSSAYDAMHSLSYYQQPAATDSGMVYLKYTTPPQFSIHNQTQIIPPVRFTPCMPSRSNEYKIVTDGCANAISSSGNSDPYYTGSSNTGVTTINAVCTSDNTAIQVSPSTTTVTYYRYLINDDYTLENTNYGNAISKQIENQVTFANNQFAEDLTVWLTAYRPVTTDFKVYSKLFNTSDSDTFDEKDWTLLQDAPSNIGLYSTYSDIINDLELTYTIGNTPNSDFTFVGSANVVSSGVSNLNGQGTTWSSNATANLVVGDLVKFYQPLFPNNFMISAITNVHSDTLITIADPITNNQFLTTPLSVDRIRSYKYQAFNNQLNDNITRYYNSNMIPIDTFNAMQIKVVFLSVSGNTVANTQEYIPGVPYIDDIRAVATSS